MSEELKGRVLVIDDEAGIREVLKLLLTDEGYDVRESADGSDALNILMMWRPDIILLDLIMPRMNGWEFRTRQLEIEQLRHVPTIFISGIDDPDAQTASLQPAAVICKPFELNIVLATIERIVLSNRNGSEQFES